MECVNCFKDKECNTNTVAGMVCDDCMKEGFVCCDCGEYKDNVFHDHTLAGDREICKFCMEGREWHT